jgi:membrane-associated PAP2 superfamily phosphatase
MPLEHVSGPRNVFLARHLLPTVAVVLLLLGAETTALDSAVSATFFDPIAGTFPLRHNAITETVGHQLLKQLVVILDCCVVGLYGLSFFLPALRMHRRVLLFLSLALTLSPLGVVLLKLISTRHCPWDLMEYGGFAPHLSLFDATRDGYAPGHCFPGGHASGGFSLLAFYFGGHAVKSPALARLGFWGGISAGTIFGMARVAQGAHFLSHNLWSGVTCWLVTLALYVVVMEEHHFL